MCVRNKGNQSAESRDWYFEDATVTAAVELTKNLMQKYGVPADHVIRHYDVTGKVCPNPYVYNTTRHVWDAFRADIAGGCGAAKEEMTKITGKAEATAEQMALHSAALTNTPAIDGMFALVNSLDIEDIPEGGNSMDLKELAKALGLPEAATEEEIKNAVSAAAKAAEKLKEMEGNTSREGEKAPEEAEVVANSTILSMLGLKAGARTEDVAASIMALRAGSPDTQAELLALKQEMQQRKVDEAVSMALKAGKITAAQSEWAQSYAMKDLDGFRSFVEKAPVVVPQGRLALQDAPTASGTGEVDAVILKNCGLTEEDVKKYGGREE